MATSTTAQPNAGLDPATSDPIVIVGTASTAAAAAVQASASAALRGRLAGVILVATSGEPVGREPWVAGLPLLGVIEGDRTSGRCGERGDPFELAARRVHARLALISLPRAMSGVAERVMRSVAHAGLTARYLPTVEDAVIRGEPGAPTHIDLHALVARPPRTIDQDLIDETIAGKTVLITGAGGSIGSELVRLCACHGVGRIVLMDRAENALFEIDRWLREHRPAVRRATVLNDVVDAAQTARIVRDVSPHIVFHAAAHKHVPLMQDHPAEALKNNLFGTKSVADAALDADAERFVLVSTDKAVKPRSVMGATKHLAERYVRSLNATGGATRFGLVRFGNVLGSASSVLPIWASQLAAGGPMTITDERMTRYFMTIPEAAALVVQAAALIRRPRETTDAGAGEVFVLDMGKPVRVVDLAERFAAAHGLRTVRETATRIDTLPGSATVAIRVTGTRPGEKLHEDLVHDPGDLVPSGADGIFRWRCEPESPGLGEALAQRLRPWLLCTDAGRVVDALRAEIPDFTPTHPDRAAMPVRSTPAMPQISPAAAA